MNLKQNDAEWHGNNLGVLRASCQVACPAAFTFLAQLDNIRPEICLFFLKLVKSKFIVTGVNCNLIVTYNVANSRITVEVENLTCVLHKALKSLKRKPQEVKILPADKRNATVVMTYYSRTSLSW